jgi:cold shock CspA family protein
MREATVYQPADTRQNARAALRKNHARASRSGTILSFNNQAAAGVVTSADGAHFEFNLSAVLANDIAELTAGRLVHFEVESGDSPKAFDVSIEPVNPASTAGEKFREIRRLRYVGFEQKGSVRTYRFQRLEPGALSQTFSVDADLVLFQKYQVGIQEGPTLCLRMLSAELASGDRLGTCSFTERHMTSFLASRPAPRAKSGGQKGRREAEES